MSINTTSKKLLTGRGIGASTVGGSGGGAGNGPTITTVQITDSSYVALDDLAVDTGGGYLKLLGTNFRTGCTAYINGAAVTTTYISSTEVRLVTTTLVAGTYSIMLFNSDKTGAIYLNLTASPFPVYSTAAGSLGTFYETTAASTTVAATSNSTVTYSIASGSLPPNITLNSTSGVLSGTTALTGSNTTYSFVIAATDLENQNSNRSFSLTVNTDVVSWNSPISTATAYQNTATTQALSATSAAGQSISYTADQLPPGLSISGSNVTGTPTTLGNTTTVFTATAATTGRTATNTVTWTIVVANDQYWPYVPLLLKNDLNANTNTRNTAIIDNAQDLGVSRTGTPTTGWPGALQTDGYWGNLFTGSSTGSYLTTATDTAFQLTNSNFTIEFWAFINESSATNACICRTDTGGTSFNGMLVGYNDGTNIVWYATSTGGSWDVINGGVICTVASVKGRWTHFAFVRSGSTFTAYVNGIQTYTTTSSSSIFQTTNGFRIGTANNSSDSTNFGGYISNFRYVKGVAVYSGTSTTVANFTVSTSPLQATQSSGTNIAAITTGQTALLTCQSNRYKDNSSNNFTLTIAGTPQISPDYYPSTFSLQYSKDINPTGYGAVYFNGSTDYLTIPNNATLALGAGNFTVEGWIYPQALGTQFNLMTLSATFQFFTYGATTNNLALYIYDNGTQTSGGTILLNTWQHIAVTRSGTALKCFINGVLAISLTNSTNFSQGTNQIANNTGAAYGKGYISNVRVVVGTAVYTTSSTNIGTAVFTPPSGPVTTTGGTYPSLTNVTTGFSSANTKLLLNFADANYMGELYGGQNNTFLDSSVTSTTITRTGTATQGSFTPYWPNGYWSNYFTSSASLYYASIGTTMNFGSANNFTIEAWVNWTAAATGNETYFEFTGSQRMIIGRSTTGFRAFWNGTEKGAAYTFNLNTWYHIAVVRSSTTVSFYINGTLLTSFTETVNWSSVTRVNIGMNSDSAEPMTGYVSNLRVINGTAITPPAGGPTAPLKAVTNTQLLTCQSNRFKDNSTNNFTSAITATPKVLAFEPFNLTTSYTPTLYGGSIYNTVKTDGLTVPSGTGISTFAGDFTIECWVYPTDTTLSSWGIIDTRTGAQTNTPWTLYLVSYSAGWNLQIFTAAYNNFSTKIQANCWTHIVFQRNGSTARAFINGVVDATTFTYSGSFSGGTGNVTINNIKDTAVANTGNVGYTSNLRIVNGTAVYPITGFTPPTIPVVAIPNTSLLLNYTNSAIYDATGQNNLVTVGSATANNTAPKFGTFSMKFNGTTDYLNFASNQALSFSTTENFTIEAWVKVTAGAFSDMFVISGLSGGGFFGFTGTTLIGIGRAGTAWDYTATHGMSLNTWYHVAVTRTGGLVRTYVGGNQVGTTSATNTFAYNFASPSGYIGSQGTNYYFNGYIQDVRISRLSRSSTSTITLPTATFIAR